MKRRNDYKVAMAESVELEPLGGMDKLSETDSKKRNGINKFGKHPFFSNTFCFTLLVSFIIFFVTLIILYLHAPSPLALAN